jgi:Protein of unknown function (DUF2996)
MSEDNIPAEAATPEDVAPAKVAKAKPAKADGAVDPGEAPAKAAKKEKPPALEDKPFTEFIEQHFLPTLQTSLEAKGLKNLTLTFGKQPLKAARTDCWQVKGQFPGQGGDRTFIIAFPDESLTGQRAFAYADGGATPSDAEPFLIDERKITLDLLVAAVAQRLNGQKWLGRN